MNVIISHLEFNHLNHGSISHKMNTTQTRATHTGQTRIWFVNGHHDYKLHFVDAYKRIILYNVQFHKFLNILHFMACFGIVLISRH